MVRIFYLLLSFIFFFFPLRGVEIKYNSFQALLECHNRIKLDLVKTWGGNEARSDEEFFKCPADIAVDEQGNLYIADMLLHVIKSFDKDGTFRFTIGREGQGPGDMLMPHKIAIDNSTLWVFENGNFRIQGFSCSGKPVRIAATRLLSGSRIMFPENGIMAFTNSFMKDMQSGRTSAQNGGGIIVAYNETGELQYKIGVGIKAPTVYFPRQEQKSISDYFVTCFDPQKKLYYLGYVYSQMIQVFDEKNTLRTIFSYRINPDDQKRHVWDKQINNFSLKSVPESYSQCVDLSVSRDGLLFVIVTNREPNENEKFFYVNLIPRPARKDCPEKTDLYSLLVFNPEGDLLAAKKLDRFCTGLYLKDNRLFLIDSVFSKTVGEYRFKLSENIQGGDFK